MPHFTVYENDEEFIFHYYADLSGNVIISRGYGKPSQQIIIPGKALLDFVANWVRDQKVAALEEQSTDEVLGLGSGKDRSPQ